MEKNLKEICNLMNDTLSNRVAMFNKGIGGYKRSFLQHPWRGQAYTSELEKP